MRWFTPSPIQHLLHGIGSCGREDASGERVDAERSQRLQEGGGSLPRYGSSSESMEGGGKEGVWDELRS